jgi:hypothetical protein
MIPNEWRKASACNGASACVEVREPSEETGGMWQIRDSKNPDGPVMSYSHEEWVAFTAGVRDGEFDLDRLEEARA